MLGYLEQSVATAIINALSTVGTVKPKFPFISSTSSALLLVAYHLKGKIINLFVCMACICTCTHTHAYTAFNPKSTEFVRQKYRRRVEQFEKLCKLINYLSAVMSQGYQEPAERPIDFNHKMCTFLKLKDVTPCT